MGYANLICNRGFWGILLVFVNQIVFISQGRSLINRPQNHHIFTRVQIKISYNYFELSLKSRS